MLPVSEGSTEHDLAPGHRQSQHQVQCPLHILEVLASGHLKAQEAQRVADELQRQYGASDWQDNAQVDLQFAVQVCLAHCSHQVGLDQEALGIYNAIVKNSEYHMAGRLRVNIGNVYFKRKQWTEAIKQYRMALDQIPTERQVLLSHLDILLIMSFMAHVAPGLPPCM
jgi:tetratricopeptide (TPR) repeat protein